MRSALPIAFALLAGTAAAEDDYVRDQNACLVRRVDKSVDSANWSGACKEGYADGEGILQSYRSNGRPYSRYEGGLKKGARDGRGKTTTPSGVEYVGEFHDGKRNGIGALTDSQGVKYEGTWSNE